MIKHSKRTLMIVENHYPQDIRVRKEAETLAEAGYSVSVIALKGPSQKACEKINKVKVYRIPKVNIFEKTNRGNSNFIRTILSKIQSIAGYVLEYAYFTSASFIVSFFILLKKGFDVIHTHNPPDTLSLLGIFYRLLGKKYVFDHHDLSPELYLTRVSGRRDPVYQALLFFERLSCKYSNIIISTNESYRQIEINRHAVHPGKIFIVRNNPLVTDCTVDRAYSRNKRKNKKTTLLFLGSINPQDGVDVLLQAIHLLVHDLQEKDFVCNIVGGGDSLASAKQLAMQLAITEYVEFKGRINDREKVREFLWSSDIGVEPAPCNEANKHSTFIKVMEFMAAGKPVVAFDLKETRFSAREAGLLVKPGDLHAFSSALKGLIRDPATRIKMGKAGLKRIEEELNWNAAAENLKNAYNALYNPVAGSIVQFEP